jgi:hypothetical protein
MTRNGLAGEVLAVLTDAPGRISADTIRRIVWCARGLRVTNVTVEAVLAELQEQGRVMGAGGHPKTWRVNHRPTE